MARVRLVFYLFLFCTENKGETGLHWYLSFVSNCRGLEPDRLDLPEGRE